MCKYITGRQFYHPGMKMYQVWKAMKNDLVEKARLYIHIDPKNNDDAVMQDYAVRIGALSQAEERCKEVEVL